MIIWLQMPGSMMSEETEPFFSDSSMFLHLHFDAITLNFLNTLHLQNFSIKFTYVSVSRPGIYHYYYPIIQCQLLLYTIL